MVASVTPYVSAIPVYGLYHRPDRSIFAAMPQSFARILLRTVFSGSTAVKETNDSTPSGLNVSSHQPPRVARGAQPWAQILLKNPSGQEVTVKKTISDVSPGDSN